MGVKHSHTFRPSLGKSGRSALNLDFLICLSGFSYFFVPKNDLKIRFFWEICNISSSSLTVSLLCVRLSINYYLTCFRWRLTMSVCTSKPIKFCCTLNEMLTCALCQNRTVSASKKSAFLNLQKTFEAEVRAKITWL